jgi:hypothetical protein
VEHASSSSVCYALNSQVSATLNDKTRIFERNCIKAQIIKYVDMH